MQYQSTPHATTGVSPGSLFFGCPLRNCLDLLKSDVAARGCNNQADQKNYHDRHSQVRQFAVGQREMALNMREGPNWRPGVVVEQLGQKCREDSTGRGTLIISVMVVECHLTCKPLIWMRKSRMILIIHICQTLVLYLMISPWTIHLIFRRNSHLLYLHKTNWETRSGKESMPHYPTHIWKPPNRYNWNVVCVSLEGGNVANCNSILCLIDYIIIIIALCCAHVWSCNVLMSFSQSFIWTHFHLCQWRHHKFVCQKIFRRQFSPLRRSCEARASLFECQERSRMQVLWL